jgi:hypothetical protein
MESMGRRRGPFVPDGGEDEEEREPGLLEQVERIRRGLPPREPTGIFAQVDRILRGLPREEPTGILAEAERKIRESRGGRVTWRWGGFYAGSPPGAYPVNDGQAGGALSATPAMMAMAGAKGWEIEGTTARAHRGATLSGLADAITNNRDDWRLIGFKGDPRTLRIGARVDIMPLLRKAAEAPGAVREAIHGLEEPDTPQTEPGIPDAAMISKARSMGWEIQGRTAVALRGATLSGFAQAITGDPNDYKLLDFKRDPRTLQIGETVDITRLLEKVAGTRAKAPTGLHVVPGPPSKNTTEWLETLAEKAAMKHKVPPAILKGLIQQESQWNVAARSAKGAVGLTQIMPDTARKDLGLRVDVQVDERLDPAKNTDAGARYLRWLYERMDEGKTQLERWRLALAAYNWGLTNVNNLLRKTGKSGKRGTVEWRQIAPNASGQAIEYVRKILGESGKVNGYAKEYGYVE